MPDETTILNAVCQHLQVLANFKPAITDKDGNAIVDVIGRQPPLKDKDGKPVKNIREVFVKPIYVQIDAEDKKATPPPPEPRLAVFLRHLKTATCDFPMEPQQLVRGEFPTIGNLVFEIQQACP